MASPPSAGKPEGERLATTPAAPPACDSALPATTAEGPGPVPLPDEGLPTAAPAGRAFGKYRLLEVLARGGMGVVYKAEDTSLRRTVALKMIRSGFLASAEEVRRFRQEAQAAAPLDHPHVIPIYEIGEQDGYHYFTMPLAADSLAGRMAALRGEPRAAVALVEKIARAVHAAHRHGVLHRDLKPANVLLDGQGEPLIADFGLARFLDGGPGMTDPGQVVGTPAYLSPEQAVGRHDLLGPATDVWALGVILFELLTGRLPFAAADRGELLRRVLTAEPTRPGELRPGLDRGLESVVLRCLGKQPSQRYASAEALADDLHRWLQGEPLADDATVRPAARSRVRRRLVLTGLGLLVVTVLVFAAGYFLKRDQPSEPPAGAGEVTLPSLVLIGEQGPPPKQLHWLRGKDKVTDATQAGGPVSFRSKGFALLELLEAPPWPRYRLEAEVRHDGSSDPLHPAVGLFIAHQKYSDRPEFFGFFQASLNEAKANGALTLHFGIYEEASPLHPFNPEMSQRHQLSPEWRPEQTRFWRRVAVEVTPEEVRLFGGDKPQPLETLALAALKAKTARPKIGGQLIPVGPKVGPGGLGLVVDTGQGSFRNVVVKPLP
jgi:hypothetical protein